MDQATFNIKLEKKHVYIILVVLIIFTTMILVFAAIPNPGHAASEISGAFKNGTYAFPGSVSISGTEGNVLHDCYYKIVSSASASSLSVTCATGEIAPGGGVACGDPSKPSRGITPSSDLTYWTASCAGTADMAVYAVCCKV